MDRQSKQKVGSRNARREARAQDAARHIKDMEARFSTEIERSRSGVRRVDEGTLATSVEAPRVPSVQVVDATSTSAILEHGRGYAQFCDMAVLDFASFTHPGGGYERGFFGQEQALCADSFLFNVLTSQRDWYQENRRRNINCELYRNRALIVPAVRFERDRIHAYADVVVLAAPHARRAREEYHVSSEVLEQTMRERVRFALDVIDATGHKKAVLGAFGCGAFGWDAETVARLLSEELAKGAHGVEEVFIAVPSSRFDEHLAVFSHIFSAFPELPGESYAAYAARMAQQRAEREADAAAVEEDDWRSYL